MAADDEGGLAGVASAAGAGAGCDTRANASSMLAGALSPVPAMVERIDGKGLDGTTGPSWALPMEIAPEEAAW